VKLVLVALLLTSCATAAPRYERVPVPATPFTGQKIELDSAICAERGKTLRCASTPRVDCWCEPR